MKEAECLRCKSKQLKYESWHIQNENVYVQFKCINCSYYLDLDIKKQSLIMFFSHKWEEKMVGVRQAYLLLFRVPLTEYSRIYSQIKQIDLLPTMGSFYWTR